MYVSKIPSFIHMHTISLPLIVSSYILYLATQPIMPRVINGRNRNSTAKAILLKPYDRPSTHTFDDLPSNTTTIQKETEIKEEVKPVKKGEYDKTHLVALIVKVSPAS
jgi:hypothetical protein